MRLWKGRKKTVRFAHTTEHDGGEIPEYHAWFASGAIEYEKGGKERWMVLECDNPTCSGKCVVSLEDLLEIPLGKVLPDPPGTRERYEQMRGQQ